LYHRGEYDEKFYNERVNRSLGWMGNNEEEQKKNQNIIKNVTIGVAGTGGIGGSTAARLIRSGCLNIKIADIDLFDTSNIQRQMGAELGNLGRNKAEVVFEQLARITKDTSITAYTNGINNHNAEDFVDGCDYILDQIDVYAVDAHYALHRAFRGSKKCKCILTTLTIGHCAFTFKYTHDSMKIEDVYGVPDKAEKDLTQQELNKLVKRIVPIFPESSISKGTFDEWWLKNKVVSIFSGCPPLCEGVLAERILMEILNFKGFKEIPMQPGYAVIDLFNWKAFIYNGK
ncbi:molybdopterin biosynthesis protein MoeB, partial [Salmonella enterica]|nr:molybdopterin biosynthesis protein MoeB [Salmonella enterica]